MAWSRSTSATGSGSGSALHHRERGTQSQKGKSTKAKRHKGKRQKAKGTKAKKTRSLRSSVYFCLFTFSVCLVVSPPLRVSAGRIASCQESSATSPPHWK